MIIKSLSRKHASFASLYTYFSSAQKLGNEIGWNLASMQRDRLLDQFYQNAKLLRARKNGNVMYHEIVSLKTEGVRDVPLDLQLRALQDVCYKYLELRAPDLLACGRLHIEGSHIHAHLMISSNDIGKSKRTRLSKSQFLSIQQSCEKYLSEKYPALKQPVIYAQKGKNLTHQENLTKNKTTDKRLKELEAHSSYYNDVEMEL